MKSSLQFCVMIAACAGCAPSAPELQPVVPAILRVTIDGKAAVDARITLHPISELESNAVVARPRGIVGSDGTVQLTTYYTHDGAPEGDYKITITWPSAPSLRAEDAPAPDRLKGRFNNPALSTLRVAIAKDQPEIIDVNILTAPR